MLADRLSALPFVFVGVWAHLHTVLHPTLAATAAGTVLRQCGDGADLRSEARNRAAPSPPPADTTAAAAAWHSIPQENTPCFLAKRSAASSLRTQEPD